MRKLILHNLIEKEGELYSAICLELNIASQGFTPEEAEKNLEEAIELYLEDVHFVHQRLRLTVFEAGDEDDFIPRPAPVEDWIKYGDGEAFAKLYQEGMKSIGKFKIRTTKTGAPSYSRFNPQHSGCA